MCVSTDTRNHRLMTPGETTAAIVLTLVSVASVGERHEGIDDWNHDIEREFGG